MNDIAIKNVAAEDGMFLASADDDFNRNRGQIANRKVHEHRR